MRFENDSGNESASSEAFAAETSTGAEELIGQADDAGAETAGVSAEEHEALRERYLRLAAEFDNFKKRTERERVEWRDRAQGQLVTRFLDVIDDLDRLGIVTSDVTPPEALLEGVRLIDRKFKAMLEAAGLEAVSVTGRFDPESHEAIMMTPTEDPAQDETIGHVLQTGYRFKGTLLRPARVQVFRLND
jgi:molecular chaperone GrpE